MDQEEDIHKVQGILLDWYEDNKRHFPWRKENISNYELVVAEVLLQRTRAETVAKHFNNFIEHFPNWKAISTSQRSSLKKALKPLGLYNQKEKRLRKLATVMVKKDGKIPTSRKELEKIPQIGQYIANAIICYIHNLPAPLLDVNMARLLERYFGPRKLSDIRYDPYLQKLSNAIVDHPRHQEINWAVLDFCSAICKKKNPLCSDCPLNENCQYFTS